MKYFRFTCITNNSTSYKQEIDEAGNFCRFLSWMYEYHFPKTKTNGISTLNLLVTDHIPLTTTYPLTTHVDAYALIDWGKYRSYNPEQKNNYLLTCCQECIRNIVTNQNWQIEPFEVAYEKIKTDKFLFRKHLGKIFVSPDKNHKAQLYAEYDYLSSGTYIFTDSIRTKWLHDSLSGC